MTRQVRNEAYEQMVYIKTDEELSRFESFLNRIGCVWSSGDSLRSSSRFRRGCGFRVQYSASGYRLTWGCPREQCMPVDEYLRKVGFLGFSVPCSTYKQAALDALTIED